MAAADPEEPPISVERHPMDPASSDVVKVPHSLVRSYKRQSTSTYDYRMSQDRDLICPKCLDRFRQRDRHLSACAMGSTIP